MENGPETQNSSPRFGRGCKRNTELPAFSAVPGGPGPPHWTRAARGPGGARDARAEGGGACADGTRGALAAPPGPEDAAHPPRVSLPAGLQRGVDGPPRRSRATWEEGQTWDADSVSATEGCNEKPGAGEPVREPAAKEQVQNHARLAAA